MKIKNILLVVLAAGAFSATAQTVLISNACDNTTGWTDNGSVTTLTIQDDASGIGTGNAMKYATTGKNNQWAELGLGQTVTLGVDDYISLAMDIRFTGDRNSPMAQNNVIRWTFMNLDDSLVGTGVGINAGADSSQGSWFQTGTTREGAKFASVNLGTTHHSVVLTLARKDDGAGSYMQFSYSIDGGTAFVREGAIIASPTTEFSFDAILFGSTAIVDGFDGILYDNIIVSTTASLTEAPDFELDAASSSFQMEQGGQTNLPLVIRNTGFDATNVTATLTTTSSWFAVSTGTVDTAVWVGGGTAMTNGFGVVAASNAPAGTYTHALSLSVSGYGPDGSPGALAEFIDITVLSTNVTAQTISPNDANIIVQGTQYINRETNSVWFQRHSDAVLAMIYPQSGFNDAKARADTGITLTFKTDSDAMQMSFRMLDFNNRGAGYGIFENGTLIEEYDFAKDTNTPETVFTITSTTPGEASVYTVTLPSWANVEFFDMHIDEGATMMPYSPPIRKTYVALGDSITHGTGQQSYTHKTYAYQLAGLLDADLYNLAVGGSRVSVPTGEMLSEFPSVNAITILIGYNDCFGDVPLDTYQSNLTAWVTACRTNQPDADIFCITPTYTDNVATNRFDADRMVDFRLAVSNVVAAGNAAGDTNLYLIHGDQIITNTAQLIDGIHLLPDGATDMANGLFAEMDAIVNAPANGITHAHDHVRIDYDGVLYPKHTPDYVQLNRFSDEILAAADGFNADRAIVPSCVVIRFTTASPTITAHFQTLETAKALKMPQYAVYRNGTTDISDYEEFKFTGDVTNPVFTITSETPGTNVMYEILLPSMNATAFEGLVLESGYDLVTNAPYERPVFVAIGDSITMNAGFQSMSYETYTWKFGRSRGMEVYNIAVGGAVTAPDWGAMFSTLNPEFVTVLFGINDWNTANDLSIYRGKYMELLDNVRTDHSNTPIFCITLVAVNDKVNPIGGDGVTVDAYRSEIIDMVNELRVAGDSNIYLIEGHAFTESDDLLDSFHFDRPGTSKFATNLNAAINNILISSNYTEMVALPTNTFADWAVPYSLNAAVTNLLNDADGDGLNNLVEYALGGNPTNRVRSTNAQRVQSGDGMEYVYRRRRNAAALGLKYTPEVRSNLTVGAWSTNGISETGSASVDTEFDSVTNQVDVGDSGFVRLRIDTL